MLKFFRSLFAGIALVFSSALRGTDFRTVEHLPDPDKLTPEMEEDIKLQLTIQAALVQLKDYVAKHGPLDRQANNMYDIDQKIRSGGYRTDTTDMKKIADESIKFWEGVRADAVIEANKQAGVSMEGDDFSWKSKPENEA